MGKIYLGNTELTPQSEVNTISGNVETVSGNVTTLSSTTTAHTADTTAHLAQGMLSGILIDSDKICKLYYGGGKYSSIVTLRGDAGGLYSVFYAGGYGASTVRNNVAYVIKNNIKVYCDSTTPTTLYIQNTGSGRQRLGMLTLVGSVDTIEIISSLPSTAQELT